MKSGFSIVPENVVAELSRLSGTAIKLAVALGKFMDKTGMCHPSTQTLMENAGIKNWRTFTKAREELESRGLLKWQRHSRRETMQYCWLSRVPSESEGTPVSSTPEDTQSRVPSKSAYRVPSATEGRTTQEQPKRKKEAVAKIGFDSERGVFTGISEDTFERWAKAYPLVDIEHEILASAEWLLADFGQRKKSNYHRFLTNWFKRSQDWASQDGKSKSSEPVPYSEEWWALQEPHLEETFDKPHKLGRYAQEVPA